MVGSDQQGPVKASGTCFRGASHQLRVDLTNPEILVKPLREVAAVELVGQSAVGEGNEALKPVVTEAGVIAWGR
jgi:hypothetical protein